MQPRPGLSMPGSAEVVTDCILLYWQPVEDEGSNPSPVIVRDSSEVE